MTERRMPIDTEATLRSPLPHFGTTLRTTIALTKTTQSSFDFQLLSQTASVDNSVRDANSFFSFVSATNNDNFGEKSS